ncbi:2Fe-2S iron-sulfur cluster-binding protein [Desulfococcaceae bacterium HSG8]|nr:2Fe-2S iron-sulfur cluster-binding protein [Desulfococcaceae bacterium HSG8]
MINILVDGKEIRSEEGGNLLQICLDNGIYIPNLCYLEGTGAPHASCRLCFVEVEGSDKPVTSCNVRVREGMVIRTDTPSVRQLQRTAFRFLLSMHHVKCKECPANKKCELQKIARFLKVGLKPKGLEHRLKKTEVDESHPVFNYYPNRCVLCGRCIHVCRRIHGNPLLTFARRGIDTVISFYGEHQSELPGEKCAACVEICPVSAITLKTSVRTPL